MIKGNKKVFIVAAVFVILLIGGNIFAFYGVDLIEGMFSDIEITNLDINMTINSDGSALIKEKHDIKFDDRGRDWWNYFKVIDFSGYGRDIFDVDSLSVNVDGVEYPVMNRHDNNINIDGIAGVTSGEYAKYQGKSYINTVGADKYEIGVIMNKFEKGKRSIEISYKFNKILLEANDVAVLYYKWIPDNNSIKVNNMTANVTFSANSEDTLYTWLHLDKGYGNVKINGNNSIHIEAKNIPNEVYVETRLTLDKGNYTSFVKADPHSLSSIIAEEKTDFDRAQAENKKLKMFLLLDILLGIGAFGLLVGFAVKDFIRKKRGKIDNSPVYLHEPPKDIPMEEAMPLFHYYDDDDDWWSDVISATVMNLVRKNYLTIIPGPKSKSASVTIMNNDRTGLRDYEAIIMDMLSDAMYNNGMITMKDFEKWCQDNYQRAEKMIRAYKSAASNRIINAKMVKVRGNVPSNRGLTFSIIGVMLTFAVIFAYNPFYVFNALFGIGGIVMYVLDHLRYEPLPKKGEAKYLELKAFEQYMLDFSNFDEKTIPDLILWKDYLVWATGMGIADEVSKQLSIVYPEYRESMARADNSDVFVYWYLYSPTYRFNARAVGQSMRTSMNAITAIKVANNAKSTAGSFGKGGGGFSGGGGGFGGGGGMGAR